MPPEPPPEPHAGTAESSGLVVRVSAEEEPIASAATANWEIAATPLPPDTTDAGLVALWPNSKSPHAIRAYSEDVAGITRFTGKPLRATYLSDLQRYADSAVGAPATQARRLRSVKSLLSFATRLVYLHFNAGAVVRGPALEQKRDERILTEPQVFAMLDTVAGRATTPSSGCCTTAGYAYPSS